MPLTMKECGNIPNYNCRLTSSPWSFVSCCLPYAQILSCTIIIMHHIDFAGCLFNFKAKLYYLLHLDILLLRHMVPFQMKIKILVKVINGFRFIKWLSGIDNGSDNEGEHLFQNIWRAFWHSVTLLQLQRERLRQHNVSIRWRTKHTARSSFLHEENSNFGFRPNNRSSLFWLINVVQAKERNKEKNKTKQTNNPKSPYGQKF